MTADRPTPRTRMSWQAATALIAVLSVMGWGVVILLMRWLLD